MFERGIYEVEESCSEAKTLSNRVERGRKGVWLPGRMKLEESDNLYPQKET